MLAARVVCSTMPDLKPPESPDKKDAEATPVSSVDDNKQVTFGDRVLGCLAALVIILGLIAFFWAASLVGPMYKWQ